MIGRKSKMNIIDIVNQQIHSFVRNYGRHSQTIYFGQTEKRVIQDWVMDNFIKDGYFKMAENCKNEICGLKIIYVEDESHLGFGLE